MTQRGLNIAGDSRLNIQSSCLRFTRTKKIPISCLNEKIGESVLVLLVYVVNISVCSSKYFDRLCRFISINDIIVFF